MVKGKSSQKTIKIDADLFRELDNWLHSDEAKRQGYHSKAPFATEAIRKLLEERRIQTKIKVTDKIYNNILKTFQQQKNKLKKIDIVNIEQYINFKLTTIIPDIKLISRITESEIVGRDILVWDNLLLKSVKVYPKNKILYCEYCKNNKCIHIEFVLKGTPTKEISKIIKEKNRIKIKHN